MDIGVWWATACGVIKLKLQYFGHLMQITDSLEKTLMLGKMKMKKYREKAGLKYIRTNECELTMSLPSRPI